MPMTTDQKADALRIQVDKFQIYNWQRHRKYRNTAFCLVGLFLLLSAATTHAIFGEHRTVAAILGTLAAFFVALNAAFNFSGKADFYGKVHAEAKSIRDTLRYQVDSENTFKAAFDSFQSLRRKAEKPPAGKGMSVLGKGAG
jgi:hypothetical protein